MDTKDMECLLKELSRIASALERIADAAEGQKAPPSSLGRELLPSWCKHGKEKNLGGTGKMKKANFILAILGIILVVVLATSATKAMGHMMAKSMDNAMDSIFGISASSFEKEGRW